MQYLTIYFKHDIKDIIPWCQFIEMIRPLLVEHAVGEFVGDDMAIDGGDCDAVFRGPDAQALCDVLLPHFRNLPFLLSDATTIELVVGELDDPSERKIVCL